MSVQSGRIEAEARLGLSLAKSQAGRRNLTIDPPRIPRTYENLSLRSVHRQRPDPRKPEQLLKVDAARSAGCSLVSPALCHADTPGCGPHTYSCETVSHRLAGTIRKAAKFVRSCRMMLESVPTLPGRRTSLLLLDRERRRQIPLCHCDGRREVRTLIGERWRAGGLISSS